MTCALFFKGFEKNLITSLYWFAVQHQISAFRLQKHGSLYLNYRSKFNELSPCYQKHLEAV